MRNADIIENKGVLAFDLTAHEILWEMPVGKALVCTAPYVGKAPTVESTLVLDGDTLVFGASDGNLYRISAADGEWIVGDFAGRVSRVKT